MNTLNKIIQRFICGDIQRSDHAVLPEEMRGTPDIDPDIDPDDSYLLIYQMPIGRIGWVYPSAMYYNTRFQLFLDGMCSVIDEQTSLSTLRVHRDKKGWHVDASACEIKEWEFSDSSFRIPVTTFRV